MVFNKLGAWSELLKLAPTARGTIETVHQFFKNNVVNTFCKEGLFDFLSQPRSMEDICGHFGYTDTKLLSYVINAFVNDKMLIKNKDETYQVVTPVKEEPIIRPRQFNSAMEQIIRDSIMSYPDRLRGRYVTFSSGMNLFNWDDALALEMYERLRRAAFRFTGALKLRGSFIDVGCGNGIGTAAIWSYYYKRGAFFPGTNMKIYGLEPDEGLVTIARDEFAYNAARTLGVDRGEIEKMRDYFPTFVRGFAENIEFEAETFDMVYTSQVLHWCNAERATKEMMRVLRPGGLLFGTEGFHPTVNKYMELYNLLFEGSCGVVYREDFRRWALESGASSIDFTTPMVVFKVVKEQRS